MKHRSRRDESDSDDGQGGSRREGAGSRREGTGSRREGTGPRREGTGPRREGTGSRAKTPRASAPRSFTPRLSGPLDAPVHSSDRPAQVSNEIRRALQAEITRGLNDPRIQGMISITEVLMTPDLAEARVRVSVLPVERASLTMSGLRAAAMHLRKRLMIETRISRVPRLVFELDERFKRESALDAVIRAAAGTASDTSSTTDSVPSAPLGEGCDVPANLKPLEDGGTVENQIP